MSDPRSVLLHIDDGPRTATRVHLARQLAETFGCQVVAQYAATPFLLLHPLAVDGAAAAVSLVMEADEQARQSAKAIFEAAASGSPALAWSDAPCGASGFTARALYADLVIVGQRDPSSAASAELLPDFVQSLVIDSGKPVLVVPMVGAVVPSPSVIMIAWKETREAARAVTAALPWLRRAHKVCVSCLDDDSGVQLDRLSTWLGAHGIQRVVRDGAPSGNDIGERLLSRAADLGAELLVMGCYGHSRSREWVLGGASRTLLQSMTLPLLMVH